MNKNLEVTEAFTFSMLRDVLELLEQKTLRKNKGFQQLCNAILCLSAESKDTYTQEFRTKVFNILKEQGLYKGL